MVGKENVVAEQVRELVVAGGSVKLLWPRVDLAPELWALGAVDGDGGGLGGVVDGSGAVAEDLRGGAWVEG